MRVLIVDDETLIRHALRLFLGGSDDIVVVGEAVDGSEAVRQSRLLAPDVVVMDVHLPVTDGIAATSAILADPTRVRVLALATDPSDVQVLAALRAGAAGLLVKDTHPDDIVAAVIEVYAGGSVLSPSIARGLAAAVRAASDPGIPRELPSSANLSARELSVVELLARGLSNAEIARILNVAETTVKANLGRVMSKWGARDRVQVLIHAVRTNLVTL